MYTAWEGQDLVGAIALQVHVDQPLKNDEAGKR
jgi:hypothetical protein